MTELNDVSPTDTWWECRKLPMLLDLAYCIFVRARNNVNKTRDDIRNRTPIFNFSRVI